MAWIIGYKVENSRIEIRISFSSPLMKLGIMEERKWICMNERISREVRWLRKEPRRREVKVFMETATRNGILRIRMTNGSRAIYLMLGGAREEGVEV